MEIDRRRKDMKRKLDETCTGSYTEARNLVFNLSLGKLRSCSPKPVEPSLWRSLLIVKILHRIAEELKVEASVANETMTTVADGTMTTDKVAEEIVETQRLDASFLLPSPPAVVAALLSASKDEGRSTTDDCAMQTDDDGERSSALALGASAALNLDDAGASTTLDTARHAIAACANGQSPVDGTFTGPLSVRDCFDEIDCAYQEYFQVDDLSNVIISLDQEFLLGSQMPLSLSAFSSTCEDSQSFAGISELDCLMQAFEEECV